MKVEGLEENAVVISGVSGKFPKSENINDLRTNLINGEDCVSSDHTRWKLDDLPKIPLRLGTIFNLKKFDNYFFGINPILAENLSPELRMTMEVTFEAIIDAGINPVELRNKTTNVYGLDGYSLLGNTRSLLANRILFCMGLISLSCTIDSTSTSSSLAVKKAYEAIKAGNCDYAIVYCQTTGNTDAISRNTCLFPTAEFQASIMKQTLKHSGLKPSDITYIEAD
ncbi:PREDICTED: fatty acid synthase-like, partial [Polistes canadensis]|uniref:fatty acid synthase-like n=1 Tax=Polistes canadensis TaxID=91411 RepID=UPI000718AD08